MNIRLGLVFLLALAGALALTNDTPALASGPSTVRVSVASDGTEANANSGFNVAVSADGRLVAFDSPASNLVAGDTNGANDVFVHDRLTGSTERVSVDSAGNQGNASSDVSGGNSISADGRFVAFGSCASNLVANDTNNVCDVFVHDRQTGATERVSTDSAGNQANGQRGESAINGSGDFVAFGSCASNLVVGDTNGRCDVFVHDRQTGGTERVSVDSAGNQANGDSGVYAGGGLNGERLDISAGGRYVAFASVASNLRPGDTEGTWELFVRDRETGATENMGAGEVPTLSDDGRYVAFSAFTSGVSVRDRQTGSIEVVADGWDPIISGDDRFVTFTSCAPDLVPGDTNDRCDVFVHDRQTGGIARVSVDSAGNQANDHSAVSGATAPSIKGISADGRFVAFQSGASNLVPVDTNGRWDIFVRDLGDSDDDGEWDPFDPCPLVVDCDSDGWSDWKELFIGTNPALACGANAWPPDPAPVPDGDGIVHIEDVTYAAARFGKETGEEGYTPRAEIATQDGVIHIEDVVAFAARFGRTC